MNINIKLLDSNSDIENKILASVLKIIQQAFNKSVEPLRKQISDEVYKAITSEPEYQSLLSGKLQYEFGIPDVSSKVNSIISIWTNNITINTTPITMSSSGLKGGFSINMIKDNYEDVLSSSDAVVVDQLKSTTLPWLEWLLLYGGKIIVRNYEVEIGSNPRSRTGLAIMKPSSSSWRVPPEFAGTRNNNWVTRSLFKLDSIIPNLIQKEIEKNI